MSAAVIPVLSGGMSTIWQQRYGVNQILSVETHGETDKEVNCLLCRKSLPKVVVLVLVRANMAC